MCLFVVLKPLPLRRFSASGAKWFSGVNVLVFGVLGVLKPIKSRGLENLDPKPSTP